MRAEDIVMSTGIAAFARGPAGTITSWNEAAENMLGLLAGTVVGKPCHGVVNGRDELGTYCCERCPSWRAAKQGQPIHPYQMQIRHAIGRRIGVTVMILVVVDADGLSLIHLVEPADEPGAVVTLWDELESTEFNFNASVEPWSEDLTFRELDIMHELSVGHDCRAIASRLALSQARVWDQISSCARKLQSRSRSV